MIGLVAYGFLWAFLITMVSGGDEQACRPLITTHDVGVLLQSLFMIPLVLAFGGIVGQRSPGARRSIVAMGIAALGLTIFSLLLIIANVLAGPFFMLWQGLLGIWLIVVNRLVSGAIPRGLRWFGTVVGVGLMIAAVFPVGNFLFVDPTVRPASVQLRAPGGDGAGKRDPPQHPRHRGVPRRRATADLDRARRPQAAQDGNACPTRG